MHAASSGDRAVDLALKRWTQDSPNYQRLQRSDCQSRKVGGVTPRMRITTYRVLHTYDTITRPARAACALRSDGMIRGVRFGVLEGSGYVQPRTRLRVSWLRPVLAAPCMHEGPPDGARDERTVSERMSVLCPLHGRCEERNCEHQCQCSEGL